MASSDPSTLLLVGAATGLLGTVLLAQAAFQSRLLRRRIAHGQGTAVFDPVTGMFSAAAAWQCLRAEASRAARLERSLAVWIGTATSAEDIDDSGRQIALELPGSATAVRVGRRQVCVVSCADIEPPDELVLDAPITWSSRSVPAGTDTADQALAFVAEVIARD